MRIRSIAIIGAFLVLGTAVQSAAQNATAISPLRFGDIYPGIPKNVSKYEAGAAAEFHISGVAGDEMSISFSLPTYMGSGPYHMQMIFSETACAMDSSAAPDQSSPGYDNLDPWHTLTYRLGSEGLTIWLGGMVVPNLVQQPGAYTATIVLTVIPTGN